MPKQPPSISAEALARICEVVDRFDAAWHAVAKGGSPPWIEDALRGKVPAERPEFLKNLLTVELECRVAFGEPPTENEYLKRFPNDAEIVADAFLEFEHSQAGGTLDEDSVIEALEVTKTPEWKSRPAQSPGAAVFQPSDVLHDYQLLEQLGQGGMGTVYKAKHSRLMKIVALKVLAPERLRDPGAVVRFQREMEAVGQLRDPHVVEAYDAGEAHGIHYLVMEFVDGLDAATILRRRTGGSQPCSATALSAEKSPVEPCSSGSNLPGPLPEGCGSTDSSPMRVADACEIIRQAALGLHHAHQRGLIHRDIKPSNLIVSSEGIVKVLDLGLARLHDEHPAGDLTSTGQVMGTVDYIAPEQITDSHKVDLRADLYSLGCAFYSLLAGEPPFGGPSYSTPYLKMKAHENTAPPSIPRTDIPSGVRAVLDQLLRKQPSERYASAAEVAAALAPFTAGSDLVRLVGFVYGISRDETAAIGHQPTAEFTTEDGLPIRRSMSPQRLRRIVAAVVCLIVFGGWLIQGVVRSKFKIGGDSGLSDSKTSTPPILNFPPTTLPAQWQPGPIDDVMPGLIPQPTAMPGVKRWQVTTIAPRGARAQALAWSKLGEIAIGNQDGLIRIYDAANLRLVRVINAHHRTGPQPDAVNALDWSPDGETLLSVGFDGVRWWQRDGRLLGRWDQLGGWCIAWHPGGKRFALGLGNGLVVQPIDRADGAQQLDSGRHVQAASWSPDGEWLATSQNDGTIRLWSADGSTSKTLAEKIPTTEIISWSSDSMRLAAGSYDGRVRVWSKQGDELAVWETGTVQFRAVAWHPKRPLLAAGNVNGQLLIWDLDQPKETAPLLRQDSQSPMSRIAWSPDGEELVAVNESNVVQVFDRSLKNVRRTRRELATEQGEGIGLAWSPNSLSLITSAVDGVFRKWDSRGHLERTQKFGDDSSNGLSWRPDGQRLAVAVHGHHNLVWIDEKSLAGNNVDLLTVPTKLAWRTDGTAFVVGGSNGKLMFFNDESKFQTEFPAHADVIAAVDWSADGQLIASGGRDKRLRIWNPNGEPVADLEGHTGGLHDVAWSPKGDRLVSASEDHSIRLWNRDGSLIKTVGWYDINTPKTHIWSVTGVSWRPDGEQIVSSSLDATVRLWSADGEPLDRLPAPAWEQFTSVTWSRDSHWIAARSLFNIVYVWNADTRELSWLATLLPGGRAVTFSPSGQLLDGDAASLDKDLIYVLENDDGRQELVSPSEFAKRP